MKIFVDNNTMGQKMPLTNMRPGLYFQANAIYEVLNPWPETTHTVPRAKNRSLAYRSVVGPSALVQATRDSACPIFIQV